MRKIGTPFLLLLILAAEPKPAPKLPIGKETTFVTGPLDKEGYIDYEVALNELLAKSISPEKNANVLLWKAVGPTPEGAELPAGFFKRLGMEKPPQVGTYYVRLDAFLKDRVKLDRNEFETVFDQQSRASRRPWAAKDYPHLAAWLKANEQPLALVVEATLRPDYYDPLIVSRAEKKPKPLIGALKPTVQLCRELAVALAARAMLRVEEKRLDEAWQDLLICHRLGRLVARGATSIDAMAGIAIDRVASNADLVYLERSALTPQQLRDRLKDLQNLPPMPPMADKMELGERFLFLDSLQFVRRGENPEEETILGMTDWEQPLRQGNHYYDRFAAALRVKDRADRLKELAKIEQELTMIDQKLANRRKEAKGLAYLAKLLLRKESPAKIIGKEIGDVAICLLMPAARKVQDSHDRSEQTQRNLHVAFALAIYLREHGRYPAKLDELAPKYLASVPDDLFSGKALVYQPSAKGYLFYSVGVNGKDDGGRASDDDSDGDDLGVRMPLPELKQKK